MKVEISPERKAWLERELAGGEARSPAQLVEAALHAYERHVVNLRRDISDADRALNAGQGITEGAGEFLARMKLKHSPLA